MAYRRQTKYHSKKATVDGITFDSKREARRYSELRLLEELGLISELKRQVKFVLIPAQREPNTAGKRGGVIKGKLIEREVSYYADFIYTDKNGEQIVEDVKGVKTEVYKIKKKLMLERYGIQIKEV